MTAGIDTDWVLSFMLPDFCALLMMCGLIVCGRLILNFSGAACANEDGRHGH